MMKSLLGLAILLVACQLSHAHKNKVCSDSFSSLYNDNYCLRYIDTRTTWRGAKRICRKFFNAELFSPEDDSEIETAYMEMEKNEGWNAWLGVQCLEVKVDEFDANLMTVYRTSDGGDFSKLYRGSQPLTSDFQGACSGQLVARRTRRRQGKCSYTKDDHKYDRNSYMPFICRRRPCDVRCDRLDVIIEAVEHVLDELRAGN